LPLSKELKDSTPIHLSVFPSEETITVIDPGHPLFGRELYLVEIYHRQDGVALCRVKVGQLGQCDVPFTATDRGIPMHVPDSLLSHQSFQQLLTTYQGIMEARDDDASATARQKQGDQTNCAKASVAGIDGQATTAICADNRGGLPKGCQSVVGSTGEA
jgi:hypothetical protein